MRPVQPSDAGFVKDQLDRYCADVLLPAMRAVHPEASIDTRIIGEVAGLVPMAQNAARDLVAELTGSNRAETVPFGTEAGIFQALGMDVVVCGPGSIEQAHKADEYLSVDQLAQCLALLERLGQRL
jgi:acetylornithine deacetylase